MSEITFNYINYKGEDETRRVRPLAIEYLAKPGFGYAPGWFLRGFDLDRQADRSFALDRDRIKEDRLIVGPAETVLAFPEAAGFIPLADALERLVLDGRYTVEYEKADGVLIVWNAESGEERARLEVDEMAEVRFVNAHTVGYLTDFTE